MTFPSDEKLMAAIQEGHLELLGILFERYQGKAFGLCIRMVRDPSLADDLVQESFVRVLRYRDTFKGPASFGAWFYRIARNTCLDHLKALERETAAIDRAEWTGEESASGSPWTTVEDDRIPIVRRALRKLSDDQREVLLLKRIHGLPYREIAQRCGSSEGAIRVRAHRALRELRMLVQELETEGDDK